MIRLAPILLIAITLAPLTSVQGRVVIDGGFQACQLIAAKDSAPEKPIKKPSEEEEEEEEEPDCD